MMADTQGFPAQEVDDDDDDDDTDYQPEPSLSTFPLHEPAPRTRALPPQHPQVLACGHRSVRIPKSGLVFPAWLVLLPSSQCDNSNSSSTATPRIIEWVARWRSKRDWSRLGRAVRHCLRANSPSPPPFEAGSDGSGDGGGGGSVVRNGNENLSSFPKAAMDRLVQNAPWIRPDLTVSTIFDATDGHWTDHSQVPKNLLQAENCWNALWTKSLQRMDDCLRRIHALVSRLQHQNLSASSTNDIRELLVAWEEFCRPADADNLLPGRGEIGAQSLRASSMLDANTVGERGARSHPEVGDDADEARGNALGQYFCSTDSASRLVTLFVSESRRHIDRALETGPVRVTIVEPSCGDGRLLRQLARALLEDPLLPPGSQDGSSIHFVGMDIDQLVLEIARSHHGLGNESHVAMEYVAGDFLSSRRCDLGTTDGSTYDEQPTGQLVLMLGGPPYTAGAGSVAHSFHNASADGIPCDSSGTPAGNCSDVTRRNLPFQFVEHAIDEYGASVVCFLMPDRYRNCPTLTDLLDRHNYSSATLESDSLFYFQGSDSRCVTQPSILQCYQKER